MFLHEPVRYLVELDLMMSQSDLFRCGTEFYEVNRPKKWIDLTYFKKNRTYLP